MSVTLWAKAVCLPRESWCEGNQEIIAASSYDFYVIEAQHQGNHQASNSDAKQGRVNISPAVNGTSSHSFHNAQLQEKERQTFNWWSSRRRDYQGRRIPSIGIWFVTLLKGIPVFRIEIFSFNFTTFPLHSLQRKHSSSRFISFIENKIFWSLHWRQRWNLPLLDLSRLAILVWSLPPVWVA